MARPLKSGLDYWSFYTDLFNDDKMLDLTEAYGPLGEAVYLRILCRVYNEGYYSKFQSMETLARSIATSIGCNWVKKNKVAEIIRFLPACELLDRCCMDENVLTSQRIQSAWLEAMIVMKRKIDDEKKYWISDQ